MKIDKYFPKGMITDGSCIQQENAGNTNVTETKYSQQNDIKDRNLEEIEETVYIFAGDEIGIAKSGQSSGGDCTTNFAVRKDRWTHGILTAGHCDIDKGNKADVFLEGIYLEKEKKIGYISMSALGDKWGNEFAFTYVENGSEAQELPCIFVPNEKGSWDYLAVTSIATPNIGQEVCIVGAKSGLVCGEVVRHVFLTKTQFFEKGAIYLINGLSAILTKEKNTASGDSGGPVFIKTSDTTAQAVGHHVSGISINGLSFSIYMPIVKTLKTLNFELVTAEVCPIIQKNQAEQKYEAQVEIPTKN